MKDSVGAVSGSNRDPMKSGPIKAVTLYRGSNPFRFAYWAAMVSVLALRSSVTT
jgi:hypothetical protein